MKSTIELTKALIAERRKRDLARTVSAPTASTEAPLAFREFAESEKFCALELSPVIAAIADASEAREIVTLDDESCERYFGCERGGLPARSSRVVVVRAGGRGGKTSRLLAPKALHAAWFTPLPAMGKGEEAYAILVAPTTRLARQTFSFVRGYVEQSPVLRRALVGKPTAQSLALRRPDGNVVRIEVFAAGRGGAQLRAKSLVFAGFDEAAFFRDAASGVVNDTELYRAVLPRLVPGAQAWVVTTPWIAGIGLVEEQIAKDWGTHQHALCVTAPTRALNPTWDPDGSIEADLKANDPDNYEREILAIPLTAGSSLFFDPPAIEAAVNKHRAMSLAWEGSIEIAYGAAGDFAFRRDSSALAIVRRKGDRYTLVALEEQRPARGQPLKPSAVVSGFKEKLTDYHLQQMAADSHYRESIREELAASAMSVMSLPEGQAGKAQTYVFTRTLLREGRLELPDHPRLVRQLRDIVAKPAPGGGLSITSPRQATGGHGDLVSALVGAVWQAKRTSPPEKRDEPERHTVSDGRFAGYATYDTDRGYG